MTASKLLPIQEWVASQVSPFRLKHIQGVVQTSEKLAKRFNVSVEKARLAAITPGGNVVLDQKREHAFGPLGRKDAELVASERGRRFSP
jgi:hypothetical protein